MGFRARAAAFSGWLMLVPGVAFAQAADANAPAETPAPATAPSTHAAGHVAASRGQATGTSLARPGFETLGDGSTRLFVELSKPVEYDTKVGKGTVTYVLKGARVGRRNSSNPLVTVHFNTPVTSARLVPHGRDLWFVVQLRAKVQPTVTMEPGKDGSAVMRIEMPKGSYLPATPPAAGDMRDAPATSGSAPGSTSDP